MKTITKTIKKTMQQLSAKFAAYQSEVQIKLLSLLHKPSTCCIERTVPSSNSSSALLEQTKHTSKQMPLKKFMRSESGQGTVEYAILVGVLAVIAMIAIIAFKDKIGELWDAITGGVNGL